MILGGKYTNPLFERGPWFLQVKPEECIFKLEYFKKWPKNKYNWLKEMLKEIMQEKSPNFLLYMPLLKNNLPDPDYIDLAESSNRPRKTCMEILFDPKENFTELSPFGEICWTEMPKKWDRDIFRRTIANEARKLIKQNPDDKKNAIKACKQMTDSY